MTHIISAIGVDNNKSVKCQANKLDEKQYCRCAPGQRISEFKSKHKNPQEDRIWELKCEGIPKQGGMYVSFALSLGPFSKIYNQESLQKSCY